MKLNRYKTKLRPCYAGCKSGGAPVLVPHPQKFCTPKCWQAFVRSSGDNRIATYRELDTVQRDAIDDWRDAAPSRTAQHGDYRPKFSPSGEPCMCETCELDLTELLPGRKVVVEDPKHSRERCRWHQGVLLKGTITEDAWHKGLVVFAAGKDTVAVESYNKEPPLQTTPTVRGNWRDSNLTKQLRKIASEHEWIHVIADADDGVTVEFDVSRLGDFRRLL